MIKQIQTSHTMIEQGNEALYSMIQEMIELNTKEQFMKMKRANLLINPYKLVLNYQNLKQMGASYKEVKLELMKIKQTNVQGLDLTEIKDSQIPRIFERVDFSNLHYLYLGKTQISSIEFLGNINNLRLRMLALDQNHISNVKPLVKIHSTNLNYLSLKSNPIRQIGVLSRVFFNQNFDFSSYSSQKSHPGCILLFPKLMSANLDKLNLNLFNAKSNSNDLLYLMNRKIVKKIQH